MSVKRPAYFCVKRRCEDTVRASSRSGSARSARAWHVGEESRACDDAAHSDSGRGCRGCHRQSQCRGAVSSHAAASCGPRRKWGVAAAAEVHSGVEARGKSTPRAPTTCAIASTCCCVVGGVRRESRAHRSSCCWPRRAAAKQQRAANSASHATQQEEPLEPQHSGRAAVTPVDLCVNSRVCE